MAGGGRTYYATGAGRFSTGEEVRKDQAEIKAASRKGELRILTMFGGTQADPQGSMSKEQLAKVLRSGDTIKFRDGTSVKINKDNKDATVNRLLEESRGGYRGELSFRDGPITEAPSPFTSTTRSVLGGQFNPQRGTPTAAPKPAPASKPVPTAKPTPRGQPKPAPKATPKPAPRATPKGGNRGGRSRPTTPRGKPTGARKPAGARGTPKPTGANKKPAAKTTATRSGARTKAGKGLISSAGVTQIGNRRKGGGGKKDRKARRARPRNRKSRKGGKTGRGRRG